ncbi:MAG TPA: hypothetical protein VJU80_13220 [Solirubrobacteraceae bacterium]|nr:hypothetical protein [Solirubrobacteraceae bacterium]
MKRFLMALALVGVAAATYVATAPGGMRAAPSPAKLQREITTLKKQVKAVRRVAIGTLGVVALCIVHEPVGVDQVGTSTDGYLFGPPQTAPTAVTAAPTSALNLAPTTETTPQHDFFELNTSNQTCVKLASTVSAQQFLAKLAAGR